MKPSKRKQAWNPHAFIIGLLIIGITFLIYITASPLRVMVIAMQRYVEREIGSIGWQPNARAFLFHVPFHRQEHALSCEVASLRSALLGIGLDVSESDLFKLLPKETTQKHWDMRRGTIWGDPNTGYVGNVDGRMPETGYGVFTGPLKTVADRYSFATEIRVNDTFAIDRALSNRHPVIAWTVLGSHPTVMTWQTPAGKAIRAPLYEHTVVIVGYRGSADRIEGVYVVDPLTSLRYETWEEFMWRTSYFDHQGLEIGVKTQALDKSLKKR